MLYYIQGAIYTFVLLRLYFTTDYLCNMIKGNLYIRGRVLGCMSKYVKYNGQEVEVPPPMEDLSDDVLKQMSGLPDDAVVYEK